MLNFTVAKAMQHRPFNGLFLCPNIMKPKPERLERHVFYDYGKWYCLDRYADRDLVGAADTEDKAIQDAESQARKYYECSE